MDDISKGVANTFYPAQKIYQKNIMWLTKVPILVMCFTPGTTFRVWNVCQKSSRNLPILSLEFPFPSRWLKAFAASLQYFMSGYLKRFVYRLFDKWFLPRVWHSGLFIYLYLHLLVHSGISAKSTGIQRVKMCEYIVLIRGLQRDVVYLCWPIAPS